MSDKNFSPADDSRGTHQLISALSDSDWEARLEEARQRRAEALAARNETPPEAPSAPVEITEEGLPEPDLISEESLPASARTSRIAAQNAVIHDFPTLSPAALPDLDLVRFPEEEDLPGSGTWASDRDDDPDYGLSRDGWIGLREGEAPPGDDQRWVPPIGEERQVAASAVMLTSFERMSQVRNPFPDMAPRDFGFATPRGRLAEEVPKRPSIVASAEDVSRAIMLSAVAVCTGFATVVFGGSLLFETAPAASFANSSLSRSAPAIVESAPVDAALPVSEEGVPRVRVFVPEGSSGEVSAAAGSRIGETAGVVERYVSVDYRVSATHVRYYHPDDRSEAERIATAVGGTARDFIGTGLEPPRGYLELYLEGDPAR